MTVTYTGQLAVTAGASEETIDLAPGTTLTALVDALIAKHGDAFASLLRDGSGNLRSTLLVALDGAQATGDRESRVLDGINELLFMTPIAGG